MYATLLNKSHQKQCDVETYRQTRAICVATNTYTVSFLCLNRSQQHNWKIRFLRSAVNGCKYSSSSSCSSLVGGGGHPLMVGDPPFVL